MTTRQSLAWAPLLLCLTACRDQEARALQNREAEFRLKEACFASGNKFFHEYIEKSGAELIETFYSQKRNSCICEVRRYGPASSRLSLELHDCLSGQRLAQIYPGGAGYEREMHEWQQRKDALQ